MTKSFVTDFPAVSPRMTKKQIAVIGAGVSGLLACKYALAKGFTPVVFEARDGIGGVWSTTIDSTKLQTPKDYYRFSDFDWPSSAATVTFPDHDQVMEYLKSYTLHFNLLPFIKFNSKVVGIEYVTEYSGEEVPDSGLWGGSGEAFLPDGKWNVIVQDVRNPLDTPEEEVYQVDFVILCCGKFSDLPNIPTFPVNKGPEVFAGEVIHSMDYAAMDNTLASNFITDKRVTVVGFQKSAIDIAAQVAKTNGVRHPCTLLFRTVHWTVPEGFVKHAFRNLNRFSEHLIHKPFEGFFFWLLATLLSPLLWVFSKLVEIHLKWIYPLKKYKMVPDHGFFRQVSSCMFTVLPANFYGRVEEGSLILKKGQSFSFCKNGVVVDGETEAIETDVVIFATGFKSDEKFANFFTSTYFQKCIAGSSAPFYRECIHPRIPQLAILGYSESPAILYTTEMRAMWLSHFLAGKFKLPAIQEMEEDSKRWEACTRRRYASGDGYKRACVSVLLQVYCNDQLCTEMGFDPRRKKCFLSEMFAPYGPADYRDLN